jgi:hypothetical protein
MHSRLLLNGHIRYRVFTTPRGCKRRCKLHKRVTEGCMRLTNFALTTGQIREDPKVGSGRRMADFA